MNCAGHSSGGAGRKSRPVLLHPVFENDTNHVDAHTIYSMWLSGETIPLNTALLEKLDQKP